MAKHEGLYLHWEKRMLPMELVLKGLEHSCCDQSQLTVVTRHFGKHLELFSCFSFQEAAMTSCEDCRMNLHSTRACFPQNVFSKRTVHYCYQFFAMTLCQLVFEAAY